MNKLDKVITSLSMQCEIQVLSFYRDITFSGHRTKEEVILMIEQRIETWDNSYFVGEKRLKIISDDFRTWILGKIEKEFAQKERTSRKARI